VAVRLFAILARSARRAVVFRRGPSKQVLLLAWDTGRDTFEEGQWLKGHIYERRCDLSPSGAHLIYFAANWKRPFMSWTAISKPPWLTAIALWQKGDAWGGGGLFADDTHVQLNHWLRDANDVAPTEGALPEKVHVAALGERWGRGEDFPVWGLRLAREGWTHTQIGKKPQKPYDPRSRDVWHPYDPPHVWTKPSPRRSKIALQMMVHGLKQTDGPWYAMEHALVDARGRVCSFGESDWADWDVNGDLLLAKDGRMLRAPSPTTIDDVAWKEIADFRAMKFEARVSPRDAKKW
jgi:hypothetical protein